MFDITDVEKEAKKEIAAERTEDAKKKIKLKLAAIEKARRVVRVLEKDYELLLLEIGESV